MSKITLLLLVLLTSACTQQIVHVNTSSDCVTRELIRGKYTNGAILALCNEQR